MKRKPKIAILANYPAWLHCEDIPRSVGHYEVWHAAMHEALRISDSYEIHRIILNKQVKRRIDFQDEGAYFHVLPAARQLIGLHTAYIWDRYHVAKCLREIEPDLVHAWGTEYCYGLCAMDFKGKKLFSLQGHLTAYAQRAKIAPFEQKQSRYEARVFRSMPVMTTESEWARDRILEMAPKADVRLWDYAVENRFFQAERKIEEAPSCLLASTNAPVKNVALAVRAFSRPELRHIKLYMAGIRADIYPALPPNIIPLGQVPRDEIVTLLSKTWAVVHPSLADSCPNIIKETRVVGLPAIITHDCGAKQYVAHEKSGFITRPNNEQEFVDAVLHVTQSKEISLNMGQYDQQRCREALSQQTMFKKISDLYDEILSSPS